MVLDQYHILFCYQVQLVFGQHHEQHLRVVLLLLQFDVVLITQLRFHTKNMRL